MKTSFYTHSNISHNSNIFQTKTKGYETETAEDCKTKSIQLFT